MPVELRLMQEHDIDAIVHLSLLAWAPVFDSFRNVLGPAIYAQLYPDWKTSQRAVVETMCSDTDKYTVWVAQRDAALVGV